MDIGLSKKKVLVGYVSNESEKVPIIMNWLCHIDLRFIHTLIENEQEKCKNSSEVFRVLSEH